MCCFCITTSILYRYGLVKGKKIITENKNFTSYGYFGIPYASPPVGELRFKEPKAPSKWFGIRNSDSFGMSCIHNATKNKKKIDESKISEDCLFINILTNYHCILQGNCSVLLYIHGGQFTYGGSDNLDSEMLIDNFVRRDIVVCTINYRLGFLGFSMINHKLSNISMNTNVGLFDILQSIKWIHDEIDNFGGNKRSITLMGHSSGGMLANYLYYSKRSENLIEKFILMSGPMRTGYFKDGNEAFSREIIKMTGCSFNTTNWDSIENLEQILKCLRNLDAKKIIDAQRLVEDSGLQIYAPSFDRGNNSFLEYDIQYLIDNKPKKPLLIGGTLYEFVDGENCFEGNSTKVIEKNVQTYCKYMCSFLDFKNTTVAVSACENEYKEDYFKTLDMTSDIEIFLPNLRQCYENWNVDSDTYMYKFIYDKMEKTLDTYHKWLPQHASDIVYITGQHKNIFSEIDLKIQDKYSQIFANFIKTSNPSDTEIHFNKFNPNLNNFYEINFDSNGTLVGEMKNKYKDEAVKFWNVKLVQLVGKYNITQYEGKFNEINKEKLLVGSTVKNFTELSYPPTYYHQNIKPKVYSSIKDSKGAPENATGVTFYVVFFLTLFSMLIYILAKNCRRNQNLKYQVFN
uniref:Carboxylic ester hydrolase n=1 Tax=Parastrongyloides trichosuri TaxID=131310 RepID=A0A0N4Z6U7_PARTI